MNNALNAPNNNELYGKNVNIKRKKKMRHLFGTPFSKCVHVYKTKFAGLTAKNCVWHTSFMFRSQKLFFFFCRSHTVFQNVHELFLPILKITCFQHLLLLGM